MNEAISLNKLVISKKNVRVVNPGKKADKELIASIRAQGLLQNLLVVPAARGKYEVIAGGRRLAALQFLAKQKEIEKDCPVDCKVVDKEENHTSLSLAENSQREAMHPADEFMAYQKLIDVDGLDVSDVAARYGKAVAHVRKLLTLGRVAPKIVADYRAGKLKLDAVMAFTLTNDQERQLACYKELCDKGGLWGHNIKNWITGEAVTTDSGIGKYVGKAAYEKAGGAVSTDLFQEKVYLTDVLLVEKLANEKATKKGEKLVKDEGWSWFEVRLGHDRHNMPAGMVKLQPEYVGVPKALEKKIDKLLVEADALEDECREKGWPDDIREAHDVKRAEYRKALSEKEQYLQFTDKQKSVSGVFLSLDYQGKLYIRRGMAKKKDIQKASKAADDGADSIGAPVADISNALREDLGAYRQHAAKAALLDNPKLAELIAQYTISVQVLGQGFYSDVWVSGIRCESIPTTTSKDDLGDSVATQEIQSAHDKLDTSWLAHDNPARRFELFCKLSKQAREKLLTFCVSQSLSIDSRGTNDLGDHIVALNNVDFAKYWRPTPENYFKRLSIPQLLETFGPVRGDDWAKKAAKMKKGEIVADLEEWFADESNEAAQQWIPEQF